MSPYRHDLCVYWIPTPSPKDRSKFPYSPIDYVKSQASLQLWELPPMTWMVDEHSGKSRGKKEKRKCGSLKKTSPLTTLCLSLPPGHSSRPAQRSPPPVRPRLPSSVLFQSTASLLEYTAYWSNHTFYIKWGLWAFKQSVHQYNAWCTVKLSLWQLLLSVLTVSTDGLLSQLTTLSGSSPS